MMSICYFQRRLPLEFLESHVLMGENPVAPTKGKGGNTEKH